ncbi:MAG: hypothetical protein RSE13_17305 [Planktothrix sp. GU0601_MAG3]|nr:MAG: hypothetical protein RSE13_17305 [Planktothrix sp. GU0601_MAG3]
MISYRSTLQQMQKAIAQSQTHFSKINGVIHTTGFPGEGLIQQKTKLGKSQNINSGENTNFL